MTTRHRKYRELFFYYLLAWILVVGVFLLVRYYDINTPLGISDPGFRWGKQIPETLTVILVAALVSTLLDPLLGSRRWKGLPLIASIGIKGVLYILFVFLFFTFQTMLERLTESGWDTGYALDRFVQAIQGRRFQMIMIYLTLCFLIAQAFRHGVRLLGNQAFRQYFSGRYLRPRVERRVLLFADMEDSTRIAERLGPVQFSSFMQDVYYDLGEPIFRHGGNVYQYVGDEVLISWLPEKSDGGWAAIRCFFAMERALLERGKYYFETYGELPVFRGGQHAGDIVAAVVGRYKSELAMHGDTMNTASRIAALAKARHESLLVSMKAFDSSRSEAGITVTFLGEIPVRGKEEAVDLCSLRQG